MSFSLLPIVALSLLLIAAPLSAATEATATTSTPAADVSSLPALPRTASQLTLTQGRHPLAMLLGVPSAYDAVDATGFNTGTRRATVAVSALHANHFSGGTSGDEALLLDGETSRVDLNVVIPVAALLVIRTACATDCTLTGCL